MTDDTPAGYEVPLHRSLLEPVTIKGVARIPAILIVMVGAILVLSLHKVTGGVLLTLALWGAAAWFTKKDPHMFDFMVRTIRSWVPLLGN